MKSKVSLSSWILLGASIIGMIAAVLDVPQMVTVFQGVDVSMIPSWHPLMTASWVLFMLVVILRLPVLLLGSFLPFVIRKPNLTIVLSGAYLLTFVVDLLAVVLQQLVYDWLEPDYLAVLFGTEVQPISTVLSLLAALTALIVAFIERRGIRGSSPHSVHQSNDGQNASSGNPVAYDTQTGRSILGYDTQTGKPIYADEKPQG
ncbi:MAG: hypothetical protein RLZZ108_1000 [Actinomycetota bacterium]|jgi:hypothetical protein